MYILQPVSTFFISFFILSSLAQLHAFLLIYYISSLNLSHLKSSTVTLVIIGRRTLSNYSLIGFFHVRVTHEALLAVYMCYMCILMGL